MQPGRIMHEPGVLLRQVTIQRPIISVRADRNHRLESGGFRPIENARQLAAPGEGFKMRMGVDQGHVVIIRKQIFPFAMK